MTTATMTAEEAVLWLRAQHDRQDLVRACYFDDPLEQAAERFRQSEEWSATLRLLAQRLPGAVLDVGAGRGLASYAFARDHCTVTALEPDPSPIIGRGAIEALSRQAGVSIHTVAAWGESLPFADNQFDVVYGRAVLHHARDLPALCREVRRILRPGGLALWVREHVISRPEDLPAFLDAHALHALYGAEHAYQLAQYQSALRDAGLHLRRTIGPLENPVNYFPMSRTQVDQAVVAHFTQRLPAGKLGRVAARLGRRLWPLILALPGCRRLLTRYVSNRLDTPGRHYAFLAVKP